MKKELTRRRALAVGMMGLVAGCTNNNAGSTPAGSSTPSRSNNTTNTTGPADETTALETQIDTEKLFLSGLPSTTLTREVCANFRTHLYTLDAFRHRNDSILADMGLLTNIYQRTKFYQKLVIHEFETVYGAEAAYELLYKQGEGTETLSVDGDVTETTISGRGEWLLFESVTQSDDQWYVALQQTENLILGSWIPKQAYANPQSSLEAQIQNNWGQERFGEDGFSPFIVTLSDHYRNSVSYTHEPLALEEQNRFAIPLEDATKSNIQELLRSHPEIESVSGARIVDTNPIPIGDDRIPIDAYITLRVNARARQLPDFTQNEWLQVSGLHGRDHMPLTMNTPIRVTVFDTVDRHKAALRNADSELLGLLGSVGVPETLSDAQHVWFRGRKEHGSYVMTGMNSHGFEGSNNETQITGIPKKVILSGNTFIHTIGAY